MRKYIYISMAATLVASVLGLAIINHQQKRAKVIKDGCQVATTTIGSICRHKSKNLNKTNYTKIPRII